MKAITLLLALGLFCQFTNPLEKPNTQKVVLKLHKQDNTKAVEQFISQLTELGLELKTHRFTRRSGDIKGFKLQLAHPDGLDWKIKGKGFTTFELKVQINEAQKIEQLSYRFNGKGDFSKSLSLTSCVNSVHEFKDKRRVSSSFVEQ